MESLFPEHPVFPEGFTYLPGFLDEAEEQMLLQAIGTIDLHTFIFQGFEAKRRVASFGYDYSFDRRALTKGREIPEVFRPLVDRAATHLGVANEEVAELLVTQYPAGAVINWHRDAPPFDRIAGISLLSDCIFKMRPHDKAMQKRGSVISFPVRRRSLYIIEGPARAAWEHSIAPVKQVRYSITLRTLRK